MRSRRRLLLPVACLAVLVAAGCSGSSNGDDATPTASGSAPSGSTSATASASPSPSVTAFTSTCDDALSLVAVSQAAGQPVIGKTSFVVGQPDASIGRLAYLNCRYGLSDTAPAGADGPEPGVEIGVSLYDTAARAAARVTGTVDDYTSTGSAPTPVKVGTADGTVLIGRGQPAVLVVASGSRTVAVSVAGRLYTGNDQIVAIAALALEVT